MVKGKKPSQNEENGDVTDDPLEGSEFQGPKLGAAKKGKNQSHLDEGLTSIAPSASSLASAERPSLRESRRARQQNRFVWTLTLLKGKKRAPRGSVKAAVDVDQSLKTLTKRRRPGGPGESDKADQVRLGNDGNGVDGKAHGSSSKPSRRSTSDVLSSARRGNTDVLNSSQDVAVSPKPVCKQRGKSKDMSTSPEAGTEAGQEPAAPPVGETGTASSEDLSATAKRPLTFRVKRRKALFGRRRKPEQELRRKMRQGPVIPRKRRRRLNPYVYLDSPVEPSDQQLAEESAGTETEPGFSVSDAPPGAGAFAPVVTARSARVIKTPRRFMDDETMSFVIPRSPQKKFGQAGIQKPSQDEEPVSEAQKENSLKDEVQQPLSVTFQVPEDPEVCSLEVKTNAQGGKPFFRVAGSGRGRDASQLKIYDRLKRLTASLNQRRMQRVLSGGSGSRGGVSEADARKEEGGDAVLLGKRKRRRRRSELKMEDLNSPGVVRRLAVHVSKSGLAPSAQDGGVIAASQENDENVAQTEGSAEQGGDAEDTQVVVEQGGVTHRVHLTGSNRRMFHLLKRAKVQLIKIDQQKQLKSSQLLLGTVQTRDAALSRVRKRRRMMVRGNREGAPQEHPREGPRIKHVCRAAAVALGQPRAMVPDDIPRLSALPLHEREGITPSAMTEDAGSPSDPESPGTPEPKPVRMRRSGGGGGFGLRSRRCYRCKGCLQEEDCGKCVFCLDKPKYGGPNKKRQCCMLRKCSVIEEKKMRRLGGKLYRVQMKRQRLSADAGATSGDDEDDEEAGCERGEGSTGHGEVLSPSRRQPKRRVTPRCYSNLLESDSTDTDAVEVTTEKKKTASPPRQDNEGPEDTLENLMRQRRVGLPRGRRRFDKNSLENTPPSVLAALANGYTQREPRPQEARHKIRVDFKEDCNIQNVWLMGGLSILTSVPVLPQCVCLLCASRGQHNLIFCQMCCEPFHWFCLPADDRPKDENKENWCCQRCKFCHVCGRKSKHSKPVLQCRRCFHCYHPACLGPTYPKPVKCNMPWVCMMCIRCKSCGVTPGKSLDITWNTELDLCPTCSTLHSQGNFCTVCLKCCEENEFDSQMIQCARCAHWVHARCEGLTDDLYEILSRLRGKKSLVFTCKVCSKDFPSNWRDVVEGVLRAGLEKILTGLRTSKLTRHLHTCKQCEVGPRDSDGPRDEQTLCDLQAVQKRFERGLYTSLDAFHQDVVKVMKRQLQEEECGADAQRPTGQAKAHYLKLLEGVFSWFSSQDKKLWDPLSKEFPCGMLSEAVLPPSAEHSYAQWLEREERDQERPKSQEDRWNSERKFCQDERQCSLCQQCGDAKPNDAGRLLYLGQNEWAHVNCCVWSAEVQELRGALLHVHSAVARGRFMRCERCGQPGATVGCCLTSCQSNYHFMCARVSNCVFQQDRKVYCYKHHDLVNNKVVTGNGFEVVRRVYVDFEGISLRRKFLTGLEPESINMMIGSLQIEKLGVLTELSSNAGKLFPVGYRCSRWYWSTVDPRKRCRYTCTVTEVRPSASGKPLKGVNCQEENRTIAHSPKPHTEVENSETEMVLAAEVPPRTPSPHSKQDSGMKTQGYCHTRRPAGGTSRPLPSPGNAASKSHHILTINDLDETRRPWRLGASTKGPNASPAKTSPALRPRSITFGTSITPPGTNENLHTSAFHRERQPSTPTSTTTSGLSPQQETGVGSSPSITSLLHSSRTQQPSPSPCKSTDVPQNCLASSQPESAEAGLADEVLFTPNVADGTVSLSSKDQELLCNQFDVDTDVAVASVLNANLEFDEALLNDNVALHCGGAKEGGEGEAMQTEEGRSSSDQIQNPCVDPSKSVAAMRNLSSSTTTTSEQEADSADEDMDHYLNFSRTVVCDGPKDSAQTGLAVLPASGSISQLDGADNDSESDTNGSAGEDDTQETGYGHHSLENEPSHGIVPKAGGESQTSSSTSCISSDGTKPKTVLENSDAVTILQSGIEQCTSIESAKPDLTFLDRSGDMAVNTATEELMSSEVQGAFEASQPYVEGVSLSSPVFDPNADQVLIQEEVLLDYEQAERTTESGSDSTRGQYVAADDGTMVYLLDKTERTEDADDSSSLDSFSNEEKVTEPVVRLTPAPPVRNSPKVHIVAPAPTKNVHVSPSPAAQQNTFSLTLPVGTSLPFSVPVNFATSSPAITVHSLSQGNPATSVPMVINGIDSLPKAATKGRTIAIRLAAPKPVQEQRVSALLTDGTGPPAPQVLLVNRYGQILVKDPQTNTFQTARANAPPYSHIRQIAKVIHSSNILPRPVPRIMVTPVNSAQASFGPGTATHVVSYSNNSAVPCSVLIRKTPEYPAEQRTLGQGSLRRSGGAEPENTAVPGVPGSAKACGGLAQAIIDKAMASHREVESHPVPSPSRLRIHPGLGKTPSPDAFGAPADVRHRTQPAILSRSRLQSQVRVKRVSSASERPAVKKCRTDFVEDAPRAALEDHSSRSSKVRIKAPTVRDVMDLSQPESNTAERLKADHLNKFGEKRFSLKENAANGQQGLESGNQGNTHVWVSSRHSDLSDWGPYSGFSSDEDTSYPKQDPDKSANQNQSHLRFHITSDDGFSVEADCIEVAWRAVVDGVQEARAGCRLEQLPLGRVSGARALGVIHDAVLFLLEQLQGAASCQRHHFRFHQHEKPEEELPVNPSGSARAEVYERKSTFDMFNFLASQHRQLPVSTPCDEEEDEVKLKSSRRATSVELPMAMRFRHLKKTSKEAVGVYRSPIHGRGLFCKRNIEAGEMVIEYAGTVIRSVLTDKREKYYDSKGIGCYMFRIDDFDVVDATMHGNAARFINHSCEPNCYSRVIHVDGQKHIVIFALRKICRGEELTYDYKFPIEDASNKLHCNCGARRCRRFLN
ncbi:histone-lysine N-methyltransferase 2B [Chanos chanos]|uniref:[histone H3]-lysine(4) N-methyltransferase n=1 Tax=Chanos chanos TaxID=29144 RepID=A0A6J2WJF0_CHACN|nr:histone-lysine N-methyltransferase 2B-like [Chanos chanos]